MPIASENNISNAAVVRLENRIESNLSATFITIFLQN
jgi:hypothetical protein